jgi:hypothetical protein
MDRAGECQYRENCKNRLEERSFFCFYLRFCQADASKCSPRPEYQFSRIALMF